MPDIRTDTVNPLYFDTMGDANNPLPHITVKKTIPHQPTPVEIEEDQNNSTTELLQTLKELNKTVKSLSAREALYRESISSYNDGKEVAQSPQASENKEEEAVWWGRKFINAVVGFFGSFFNKTSAVTSSDETVQDQSAVQPLPSRVMLNSPEAITEAQLDKLIEEMALALDQIKRAAKEAEEILLKGPADVAMENGLKVLIDKQTINSKELSKRLIDIQNIAAQQIAKLRELVSEVRGKLDRNVNISETLGWINTATTAVVLLSGVAIFLTGGGSAVVSSIGVVGGLFDGVGTIAKSSIDTTANKQRGEIQYHATTKGMMYTKVETNLNDMELLSKGIHNNYEKLIELAALKREASRSTLQQ